MRHWILVFTLACAGIACDAGSTYEPDPPTLFPVFQGTKFGFIDASGKVVIDPTQDYWSDLSFGGGVPGDVPAGKQGAGTIKVGEVGNGTLFSGTRDFWNLDAAGVTNISVVTDVPVIDYSAALYEFRNGSWQQIRYIYSYGNFILSYDWSASRPSGPLAVEISNRYDFTGSLPYTISFTVSGMGGSLYFLDELRFNEGLMPIKVADRWGYLATDGSVAITPQFEQAGFFFEELAQVEVKDLQGFIDRKGATVIQPIYERTGPFRDGLAAVYVNDDQCGYIDPSGKTAINPVYETCGTFQEGIAIVKNDDDRWGAVDKEGVVLVAPAYRALSDFVGGYAAAKITDDKWGIIDREGKAILAPTFDRIYAPRNKRDLWLVKQKDKYGFVNLEGKFVIGPTLDDAFNFSGGVAAVRLKDKWGFMLPDGKYLGGTLPQYDEVRNMRNERAAVRMGNAWGFIDEKGDMKISPTYDVVGSFEGKLAAVIKGGRLGYIDRDGKVVRELSR